MTVNDSSEDGGQDEALILNFKRDTGKRAKVEHRVKVEQVDDSLGMIKAKESYDFGDLSSKENPLRKLVVPMELLWEF